MFHWGTMALEYPCICSNKSVLFTVVRSFMNDIQAQWDISLQNKKKKNMLLCCHVTEKQDLRDV
jgi:hypothetical protein